MTGIKVYDGSTTFTTAQLAINNVVSNDVVSLSGGTADTSSKNAGTWAFTAFNGLALTGPSAGNYTLTGVSGTGTISAAPLSVTAQSDSRGYNGTVTSALAPVVTGTLYDAVSTGATQHFDTKNVGTGKTLTPSGLVINDGNSGNNYAITYVPDGTGIITPASVSVTAQSDSRGYNGTVSSAVAPVVTGTLYDAVSTAATQRFDTKNATTGKTLTASGLVINDGNSGNNYAITYVPDSAGIISPANLSVSTSNVIRTYDGSLTAAGNATVVSGTLFAGDTLTGGSFAYTDPNSGQSNKVVTVSGVTVGDGINFGNYNLVLQNNTTSTIDPLHLTWSPIPSSTNLGDASNWSNPFLPNVINVFLPDGLNVIAPTVLNVTNAVFNSTSTTPLVFQTIDSSGATTGSFELQSGSLTINGDLITPSYKQTGGTLSVSGALTVKNAFSQTAGDIVKTGPVSITQASGNLAVRNITGSSITLQAPTGAITQQPSTGLTGFLIVKTGGGANFSDPSNNNTLSGFAVSDVGLNVPSSGNISLINNGALDLKGISLANGNLSIETHSPITVSSPVNVSGNITLAAPTPGPTSNITINSPMTSTAGGISISAANNFIQNSNLSAALAIDVSAGGSMFFGPGAYSVGNPVTYMVNGAPYMPPWIASTLSGGATDFVVAFLDQFQAVLDAQQVASNDDPLGLKQRGHEGIVVEGEICKP